MSARVAAVAVGLPGIVFRIFFLWLFSIVDLRRRREMTDSQKTAGSQSAKVLLDATNVSKTLISFSLDSLFLRVCTIIEHNR